MQTLVDKPFGKLLYRTEEGADLLGISRATVYKEIAAGRIRVVKIGASTRITAAELDRYVRALHS